MVYGSRGLWSVLLVAIVARHLGVAEGTRDPRVLFVRLSGSVLILAAVSVVVVSRQSRVDRAVPARFFTKGIAMGHRDPPADQSHKRSHPSVSDPLRQMLRAILLTVASHAEVEFRV